MKKLRVKIIICLISLIILSVVGYYIKTNLAYSGEIIVIKGTNVYHRQDCDIIKKASIEKLIFYRNAFEAVEKDSRPCNSCRPPQLTKEEGESLLKLREQQRLEKERIEQRKVSSSTNSNTKSLADRLKEVEEKNKELAKNIKILGKSSESNHGMHKITCSVKNENSVNCKVVVQAIYYDSNNNIINTEETIEYLGEVPANEIKGFTITNFDNVSKINRFELNVIVKSSG